MHIIRMSIKYKWSFCGILKGKGRNTSNVLSLTIFIDTMIKLIDCSQDISVFSFISRNIWRQKVRSSDSRQYCMPQPIYELAEHWTADTLV